MRRNEARNLAKYHKFTKKELYNILKDALNNEPDEFWNKPNKVNKIFNNGYYFNRCREWIRYEKGVNDDEFPTEIATVRVLEIFGKYSKVQLPKKEKSYIETTVYEKPKLD